MSFGQAPIYDTVCINCENKDAVRRSQEGKPTVRPKPVKLTVESHAVFGGSDYNRGLGESPKMKMILLPIGPRVSKPRQPAPQPAPILTAPLQAQPGILRPPRQAQPGILRPPLQAQPAILRPLLPSEPLRKRPPIHPQSRKLRRQVPQQAVRQSASNRSLSLRPKPTPRHWGQPRVVPVDSDIFSSRSAPRDKQSSAPSQVDDDDSFEDYVAVPFFTRRRLHGVADSDTNTAHINMIYPLTLSDFDEVVKSMEKAFVLFYDSNNEGRTCAEKEFIAAAGRHYPYNHTLATVDCSQEQQLCAREEATRLPIFKLYSNGFDLSTIRNVDKFTANQIQQLIKMTPVLTQPRTIMAPRLQRG